MAEPRIQTRRPAAQDHSRAPIEEPDTVMRGYVLSEAAEYKLRTVADAMRGIAALTEGDSGGQLTETINATELAAIFRLISEATDNIRNTAAFTHEPAKVRPRVLN